MTYLTTKEQEILSLVSSGLTTKEIADKLNISHHTVESHRKNLLRKCQAKNSAELIHKTLFAGYTSNVKIQDPLVQ
jgi:two-component system, NarL family, response regulator NreC